MGLHDVCKVYGHHFDLNHDLEVIKIPERNDYLLLGICTDCGRWRIVSYRELKEIAKKYDLR